MQIWQEIESKTSILDKAVCELGKRGRVFADAERKYRIGLAQKILMLKADGMQATLIGDVARGDNEIANLKFARDEAEAVYKAAIEGINVNKIQVKVLSEQMDREWNRSGNKL